MIYEDDVDEGSVVQSAVSGLPSLVAFIHCNFLRLHCTALHCCINALWFLSSWKEKGSLEHLELSVVAGQLPPAPELGQKKAILVDTTENMPSNVPALNNPAADLPKKMWPDDAKASQYRGDGYWLWMFTDNDVKKPKLLGKICIKLFTSGSGCFSRWTFSLNFLPSRPCIKNVYVWCTYLEPRLDVAHKIYSIKQKKDCLIEIHGGSWDED